MLIFQIESVDYTFILKSLYGVTVCSAEVPATIIPCWEGWVGLEVVIMTFYLTIIQNWI